MQGIAVDAERSTVTFQAGVTAAMLWKELFPLGLAVQAPIYGDVGLGGYTLGGEQDAQHTCFQLACSGQSGHVPGSPACNDMTATACTCLGHP